MGYSLHILIAYSAYVAATVSPGPANLAIMATSARAGRRAGLQMAMGVLAGSLVWGNLAAFGLSAVLSQLAWLLTALKIAGGLYLLWLAAKSLRSALRGDTPATIGSAPSYGYLAQGFAIHMTNPKAVFAWIAIIALGLREGAPFWAAGAIVVGCGLLGAIVFGTFALVFSTGRMMRLYAAARRPIDGVVAAFFAAVGIRLLVD